MQHSDQPNRELDLARDSLEQLKAATSIDEAEECWKEFLSRIERCWNKATAHFKKSPKWNSWHGKYVNLRKKDELLCYLVNARGADEHTTENITQIQRAHHHIDAGPNKEHLLRWEPQPDGKIVVELGPGATITTSPATMTLLAVVNRGVCYKVPTTHIGAPLDGSSAITIAEAALGFYKIFLDEAERYFVSK